MNPANPTSVRLETAILPARPGPPIVPNRGSCLEPRQLGSEPTIPAIPPEWASCEYRHLCHDWTDWETQGLFPEVVAARKSPSTKVSQLLQIRHRRGELSADGGNA
jgi:hypothetical protein